MACLPRSQILQLLHCLVMAGLGSAGCRRSLPELDRLIEQNTIATGGGRSIQSVESIEVDLHIVDPGFEADGIYRAIRPGKMRIDVMVGGKHVFTEAFNGTRGWEWQGKGDPIECAPAATAALRHGVEYPGKLFGLHEMRARGNRLQSGGNEQINGIDYHVIHLTLTDGYRTSLYLDARNNLITRRRDVRPLHVDIDPTPTTIETQSSDFRTIAGVLFPFATVDIDLKTGKVLERTTVRSLKVNPRFDEVIFDKL